MSNDHDPADVTLATLQAEILALRQQVVEQQQTIAAIRTDAEHYRTIEEALRRSEKRYREITELISDSVYSVCLHADQTLELEWGFNGLEQLTGYTLEELPAQNWLQLVHPDDLELVTQRVARLYAGEEVESEYRIVARNGDIRRVRDHGRPVWDEQEQRVVRIYGALKDVTMYWQTSEALRENEERFRQLMDNTDQVFWMRDSTSRQMLYVSPAYAQIWGRSCESLYQNPESFLEAVHPDDLTRVRAAFSKQYENDEGVQCDMEYRIIRPDGEVRWVRVRRFTIQGATNRIAGIVEDITQRKDAEALQHESDIRMRTLLSAIPDMVFRIDQHGRFVDFKTPRDDLLLLPPDNFLGRLYQDVLPPFLSTQLRDSIIRAHRSGKVERFEYTLTQTDGQNNNYEARVVVGDDDHAFCVVRNISDYKQSEKHIRQHAARAEALARIATRLNARLELPTVLHTVCEETRAALQVDMVLICLYDQSQHAFIVADGVGIPRDMIALINPTPVTLIQNWEPVATFYDLNEIHSLLPNQHLAENLETRSMIRALLIRDQEIVGLLVCLATYKHRVFNEAEQLLIQGIAAQAAQAITNARLFDTVEQERALLSRRIAERTTELIQANAELAHAVRTKDEFLANMSHELRTPLNTILGLSEALQEQVYGLLNERQERAAMSIEQSAQHLLALINDILDLSKVEAGHVELHLEPVNLITLCQASLQFIKQQALKKNITVSVNVDTALASAPRDTLQPVPENLPDHMMIVVDQRRLKQILINLLTNAVKFTPTGGTIGLDVHSDMESQVVSLSVWDTGIGIRPEDQHRLFQPFIQVDSSLSREYQGTGLGLALVLRLTELHGGSVTLESEFGSGSRFTISLPSQGMTLADGSTRIDSHQEVAQMDTTHDVSPDNAFDRLHSDRAVASDMPLILLAEDNEASISTTLDYLDAKGYQVVVARNGLEAITYAEEYQPAMILMDIQMPKMDGLTAIRRIRASTRLQHIPIIALTALAMRGDRERCLEAGANEYMSKPVQLKELVRMVENYLTSLIQK